jgi:hypothetical protein
MFAFSVVKLISVSDTLPVENMERVDACNVGSIK